MWRQTRPHPRATPLPQSAKAYAAREYVPVPQWLIRCWVGQLLNTIARMLHARAALCGVKLGLATVQGAQAGAATRSHTHARCAHHHNRERAYDTRCVYLLTCPPVWPPPPPLPLPPPLLTPKLAHLASAQQGLLGCRDPAQGQARARGGPACRARRGPGGEGGGGGGERRHGRGTRLMRAVADRVPVQPSLRDATNTLHAPRPSAASPLVR